jgi:hypothetical protein
VILIDLRQQSTKMVDYSKWDKSDISSDEDDLTEDFQQALQNELPHHEQFPMENFPIPPEQRAVSFVEIDTADDLNMICRIVRQEDPATWKPTWPNSDEWGLQEDDILDKIDDVEHRRQWVMAREMRRMKNQQLYHGRDTPELQFCKKVWQLDTKTSIIRLCWLREVDFGKKRVPFLPLQCFISFILRFQDALDWQKARKAVDERRPGWTWICRLLKRQLHWVDIGDSMHLFEIPSATEQFFTQCGGVV